MSRLSLCLKNCLRYWQSIRKGATNFQSLCLHLHRLTPLTKFLPNTTMHMRYTFICYSSYILPWLWISQIRVNRGFKNSDFAHVPQSLTILYGLRNGPAAVPLGLSECLYSSCGQEKERRHQQRGDGSCRETAEHRKNQICTMQQGWSSLAGDANKGNTVRPGAHPSLRKSTGEFPLRQTAGILDWDLILSAWTSSFSSLLISLLCHLANSSYLC